MKKVLRGPCKARLPLGDRLYGTCREDGQESSTHGTACGECNGWQARVRGKHTRRVGHRRFGVQTCRQGALQWAVDVPILMDETSQQSEKRRRKTLRMQQTTW